MEYKFSPQQINNVYDCLDRGWLLQGMKAMQQLLSEMTCAGINVSDYRAELDGLQSTYNYMLQYAMQGMPDPNRAVMREQLRNSLYLLAYRLRCLAELEQIGEHTIYNVSRHSVSTLDLRAEIGSYLNLVRRAESALSDSDMGVSLLRRADGVLTNIFLMIWTCYPLSRGNEELLLQVVCDEEAPLDLRMQVVSALSLLLTRAYDPRAVQVLLRSYAAAKDARVKAAALTGAVVALMSHHKISLHDADTQSLMRGLSADGSFMKHVSEVVQNLAATRETENINRTIREEILPEIQRSRADLASGLQDQLKGLDPEELEENPAWRKLMEDSSLTDKLKKLSDWQMEGADIMMSAFGELKRSFFFKTIKNWFVPFDMWRLPEYGGSDNGLQGFLPLLEADGLMCDSDKYSFMLAVSQMPAAQRNMISSHLDEQVQQMIEEQRSSLSSSLTEDVAREITRTVRGLFRFFRQYERRSEFRDPFGPTFDPEALRSIPGMVDNQGLLGALAEFFMSRGFYADAASLYDRLLQLVSDTEREDLMQKAGYCYQKQRDYKRALQNYEQAATINGESKWLLRQMALCHKRLGEYAAAVDCYEQALMLDQENVRLMLNLANCLLETGEYERALKLYFKLDYLSPDTTDIMRPMAWTLLMLGRDEECRKLYEKILSQSHNAADLRALGHLRLKTGDVRGAVDKYAESVQADKRGYDAFLKAMTADAQVLRQLGVDDDLILMVPDLVLGGGIRQQ